MIIDQLEQQQQYPYGQAWNVAFEFLQSLRADAAEQRYPLQEDAIFAMVDSYETKRPDLARPESHRKYVDIQMLLSGTERIDWWPTRGLMINQPFAPDGDCALYDQPESHGVSLILTPGRFAVFFPEDAHMPGLQISDTPVPVKKVVIKIDVSLL